MMNSYRFPALAALLASGLIGACSSYVQVVTLQSDAATLTDARKLVCENDTVRVAYDFYGQNMPLRFRIFNKLAGPLYVHWSSSAYIEGKT